MDPYYEHRLREEVLYLHSLWHQGPSRPNPNLRNPIPNSNTSIALQLSNPTQFKKKRKIPRGRKGKNWPRKSYPPLVSDIEWPCNPPAEIPPATTSGWPCLKLHSTPTTRLPTAEEQARFAANQLQQKALKATHEFLSGNVGSDGDDDDSEDDLMDEDVDEEYNFFLKVFMEDSELRGYYEKNHENGELCCLVCGGVGKKVGKRFKDCVALVQHSITIAKTKKKRAHRAYGQVICKVLNWDIDRLPTIIMKSGDPLSGSLAKSGELEGNADDGGKEDSNGFRNDVGCSLAKSVKLEGNANDGGKEDSNGSRNDVGCSLAKSVKLEGNADDGGKEDFNGFRNNIGSVNVDNAEAVPAKDCNVSGDLPDKRDDLSNVVDGVNSLVIADGNKSNEDLDNGISNMVEGNAEAMVLEMNST